MPERGDAAIRWAMSHCCGFKEWWGANRGPLPDQVNRNWSYLGGPWCMAFASQAHREAGTEGLFRGSLSAGTGYTASVARTKGLVVTSGSQIHPGALWLTPSHGALIRSYLGGGMVATVEGNVSNGVYAKTRSIYGATIVSPAGLGASTAPPSPPPPKYDYWLYDARAERLKRTLLGRYRKRAYAENRVKQLLADPVWRSQSPRIVETKDAKGPLWLVIAGPVVWYGPWSTNEAQDNAKAILVPRLRERYGVTGMVLAERRTTA